MSRESTFDPATIEHRLRRGPTHDRPVRADRRRVLVAFPAALVALAGCAPTPVQDEDWPRSLPPRERFVDRYDADTVNQQHQTIEAYLRWVVRFYIGWGAFPDGWEATSRLVLEEVPADRRDAVADTLAALGERIAGEWSKESPERRIFTRTIAVWGESLAGATDSGTVEPYLALVSDDVDALLAGTLEVDAVRSERYASLIDASDTT